MRRGLVMIALALVACSRTDMGPYGTDAQSADTDDDDVHLDGDDGLTPLLSTSLVVRYAIAGESGALVDSGPAPALPLPLTLVDGPTFVADPIGHGLSWSAMGADGRACASVAGTKVAATMGGMAGTIEVVADIRHGHASYSRLMHIGFSQEWVFALGVADDDAGGAVLIFSWTPVETAKVSTIGGAWKLGDTVHARHVYHLVLDTTRGAPDERVTLYVDGVVQAKGTTPPSELAVQESVIDINKAEVICLGNREVGAESDRSIEGVISYGAIYERAFTADEVVRNSDRLGVDDDAP